MKVMLSLDDDLMKRVDEYADTNYMSRSGLVSLALVQFLNASDVSKAVVDLSLSMRKIADSGKVDHETIEQLEDLERLAKMLLGRQ